MAFIREGLFAFFGQPIERKRSDHRLKSVKSNIDPRAWSINNELRRQHFINVVSTVGVHRDIEAGDKREDEDNTYLAERGLIGDFELQPDKIKSMEEEMKLLKNLLADKENEIEKLSNLISTLIEHKGSIHNVVEEKDFWKNVVADKEREIEKLTNLLRTLTELQDTMPEKQEDCGYWKNVVADKENEIEELHYRIHEMTEELQALLESLGGDTDKHEQLGKDKGSSPNEIVDLQDQILKLQDELNVANEKINDFQNKLEFAKQIEDLAIGDDDSTNKIIFNLNKELASERAANDNFRDIVEKKDHEIKALKDLLNEIERDKLIQNEKNHMEEIERFSFQPDIESLPQVEQFSSDIDVLQAENKNLKNNLLIYKDKAKNCEDQVENLMEELQHSKEKNEVLLKELESVKQQGPSPVSTDNYVDDLRNENNKLIQEMDQLKKQIEEFERLQFQPASTESQPKEQLFKELEVLREENKNLKASLLSYEDKAKSCELDAEKLLNELQAAKIKNEDLLKGLKPEKQQQPLLVSDDDINLKQMLEDAENEIRQLKLEKDKDLKLIQDMAAKDSPPLPSDSGMDVLNKENTKLKQEIEDLKKQIKELEKLQFLPASVESQPQLEQSSKELLGIQEENKKLMANLKSCELQVEQLLNELQAAKRKNEELLKDLDSEKPQYPLLTSDDDINLKKMLEDAENEIRQLKLEKDKGLKLIQDMAAKDSPPLPSDSGMDVLNKENNKLKQEIEDLKKQIKELEKLQFQPASVEYQPQVEKSSKELLDLQEECKTLTANLKSCEDKTKNCELQVEKLLNETQAAKRKNEELLKDLESDKKQHPSLALDSDGKLKKLLEDAENEIKQLKLENDKNLKTIQDMAAKAALPLPSDNDMDRLNKENINLKLALEDMKKQTENLKNLKPSEKANPEIEKLLDELKTLKEENQKLKEIMLQIDKLDKLNKENTLLKQEIEDLKKINEELKKNKQQPASVESHFELSNELEMLKAENKNLKANLSNYEDKTKNCELQMEKMENELKNAKRKIEELLKDLEFEKQLRLPLDSTDDNKLKQLLANAEKEIQQLKLDKDKDFKLIQDLRASSMPRDNDVDRLIQENNNLKKELEGLKKQIEYLGGHKSDKMLNDLTALQHENEKLKRNMAAYKDEDLNGKKLGEEEKEIMFKDKDNELNKLINENSNLKKEIKSLKKQISDLQNNKLQTESKTPLTEIENELKALKEENKKLKEHLATIEETKPDTAQRLQSQVDNLEGELRALRNKNAELQKHLENTTLQQPIATEDINKLEDLISESSQLQVENKKLKDSLIKYESDFQVEIDSLRDQVEKLDSKRHTKIDKEYENKDSETRKLNKILQKAIRSGLKSLDMDELEYVHEALNNTVVQKQGRKDSIIKIQYSEVLQITVNAQEKRLMSLMQQLEANKLHNNNLVKTIMNYSNQVQSLKTTVGLQELKVDDLDQELTRRSLMLNHEKEKAKKLEEMLMSVLVNCKCTNSWSSSIKF